jgi:hypothetical protein
MPVSFSDLQSAFEFVSSGGTGENEAYLDRQSGKIYWHSAFGDNGEEWLDDIGGENTLPSRTREISISASLWSWISLVSSCRTNTRKFAISSAEQALTGGTRICWCGVAPSNVGIFFEQGRGSGSEKVVRGERDRP